MIKAWSDEAWEDFEYWMKRIKRHGGGFYCFSRILKEMDDEVPMRRFNKYRIGGEIYDCIPIYDIPRCIAIETQDIIKADTVEFIM